MKSTRGRMLIYVAALLFVLIVALEFQAYFWSHDYALAWDQRRITQLCISSGRDPKLLSEPHETKVGNAPWAFEWIYQGQPRYLFGVWFSRSGVSEFYGGDPDLTHAPICVAARSPQKIGERFCRGNLLCAPANDCLPEQRLPKKVNRDARVRAPMSVESIRDGTHRAKAQDSG